MADEPNNPENENRRRHERHALLLAVHYPGSEGFTEDHTENLSEGGIFIVTERWLDVGTRLPVRLSFRGLVEPFEGTGVVRWQRPDGGPPARAGLGVDFSDDPAAMARFTDLVARIRALSESETASHFRVVIADTADDVRFLLKAGLRAAAERKRNAVTTFDFREIDSADALRADAETGTFDLLALDASLPGLDDPAAFVRELRAKEIHDGAAVVAMAETAEILATIRLAGATYGVRKPIQLGPFFDTALVLMAL